ncbi:alpha/beta hydrolase family esterase [Nocardia sp. NPDC004278]
MLARNVKNIDDVGFLGALVDEVSSAWSIDRHRVYAVGFSLGGQMTIRLLHDAPELLAGAALIASNQPAGENLTTSSRPPLAVRVVLIHGTDDPLAPYSGGYVSFRGWFPEGPHLSAAQTAAYFAHRNGITVPPSFHWINARHDRGRGAGMSDRLSRIRSRTSHPLHRRRWRTSDSWCLDRDAMGLRQSCLGLRRYRRDR